jgi:hypothetical protein
MLSAIPIGRRECDRTAGCSTGVTGTGGIGACDQGAGGPDVGSPIPHEAQKAAPATTGAPHCGQNRAFIRSPRYLRANASNGAPHAMQNRAPSIRRVPHPGQKAMAAVGASGEGGIIPGACATGGGG